MTTKKRSHVTPRQAIHRFCYECMGENWQLVTTCYTQTCPVWHHRQGKRDTSAPRTPVKAIRAKCLDCTDGSPKAVRECEVPCPLYPFRMNTNPNCRRRQAGAELTENNDHDETSEKPQDPHPSG